MQIMRTIALLSIFSQFSYPTPLREQFKHAGYVELRYGQHGVATFDALYTYFDEFIAFAHANPAWAHILYRAKERFIRSSERSYYATDFFGFYDESTIEGRNQVSFYYATHFHAFVCSHYPESKTVPEIVRFFQACFEIQKSCTDIFAQVATELGIDTIFSCAHGQPPILLKVVKYFPSYRATRPHYDGTAFSLFLDSTDNQALLLSAYKVSFAVDDFYCPTRIFSREQKQNSILLIPGSLLTDFAIYPTPHIVVHSGSTRYATIAFAMRPEYISQKNELSSLPNFKD